MRGLAFIGATLIVGCTSLGGLSGGASDDAGTAASDASAERSPDADGGTSIDATADVEAGSCGAGMIDAGGTCIDAFEVTNGEYAVFLATKVSPNMPSTCSWKTGHVPAQVWPAPPGSDRHPVVYVDWCDAWAYCAYAGKRLCGHVGGGPVAPSDAANALADEWYRACSAGGKRAYPYGDTLSTTACNGMSAGRNQPVDVGSLAACEGGYPGLFDMSGNVAEWVDQCDATTGPDDTCHPRGGSEGLTDNYLACSVLAAVKRNQAYSDVGIRCCAR